MPPHTAPKLLEDLALGRLAPGELATVEAHLAACTDCGVALDRQRETARLLAHLGQGGPERDIVADVLKKIESDRA